jgi:hypothetical protein
VQGLLSEHLRGITIATPYGDVIVRGGSASVSVGDTVIVEAWDRRADVLHEGHLLSLVSGEKIELWKGNVPVAERLPDEDDAGDWVAQNRTRDAVHREEIAQWQIERRAAQAGILPTSPLYAVKRVVERVDVLFTLDPEEKVQKQLDHASTRLSEAAALISEGQSGASLSLEEYRTTLLAVATGSGQSSVTQFLIRQEVAENAAELAATLPGNDSYALKKAVLESGAELPEMIDERDVKGVFLVDSLDVLREAVDSGDADRMEDALRELEIYLPSLDRDALELRPEIRAEAIALLTTVAETLEEQQVGTGAIAADFLDEVEEVVPIPVRPKPPLPSLTEDQLTSEVAHTLNLVFGNYKIPKSQRNELLRHMKRFSGHPDEGRFLRRLLLELPEESELRIIVRRAIQQLRNEQSVLEEVTHPAAGTGSEAL